MRIPFDEIEFPKNTFLKSIFIALLYPMLLKIKFHNRR